MPFEMPVVDVVALGRLPHEPPLTGLRASDRAAVDAAIERVGITDLRHRDVRDLSMGERQLVFIAVALAQAAPIVVLDEPTAHLDIRHQVEVMQLLVDLHERDGTTVIAVLHDLALAAHFFDRVVVMADGRGGRRRPAVGDPRRRPYPGRVRGRPGARADAGVTGTLVAELRAATAILTRLPVAGQRGEAAPAGAGAAAFPVVGLVIGLLAAVPLLVFGVGASRSWARSPRWPSWPS